MMASKPKPHTELRKGESKSGLSLVIALIVATVALAVGLSLLDVTLRQFILSGVARDSEISFHAAYAGIECARFQDIQNDSYAVPHSGVGVTCMGDPANTAAANSGDEQLFEHEWQITATPLVTACTEVSVFKFNGPDTIPGDIIGGDTPADNRSCSSGSVCTVIQSRGYNVACSDVGTTQTVERQVVVIY